MVYFACTRVVPRLNKRERVLDVALPCIRCIRKVTWLPAWWLTNPSARSRHLPWGSNNIIAKLSLIIDDAFQAGSYVTLRIYLMQDYATFDTLSLLYGLLLVHMWTLSTQVSDIAKQLDTVLKPRLEQDGLTLSEEGGGASEQWTTTLIHYY